MSVEHNSIDKFGRRMRRANKNIIVIGPPGLGFKLLPDGNYDLESRRLKNIKDLADQFDAVTRKYADGIVNEVQSSIAAINTEFNKYKKYMEESNENHITIYSKIQALQIELSGVRFKLSTDGNNDLQRESLKNVGESVDEADGVNRRYVDVLGNRIFNLYWKVVKEVESITSRLETFEKELSLRVESV